MYCSPVSLGPLIYKRSLTWYWAVEILTNQRSIKHGMKLIRRLTNRFFFSSLSFTLPFHCLIFHSKAHEMLHCSSEVPMPRQWGFHLFMACLSSKLLALPVSAHGQDWGCRSRDMLGYWLELHYPYWHTDKDKDGGELMNESTVRKMRRSMQE